MELRTIGGMDVSLVGLGCNNFGGRTPEDRSVATIRAAIDCGITLLDTSDNYTASRSEEIMGRALAGHRHQVLIATKFGGEGSVGARPEWARQAVDASLRRLRTDVIDLYQLHQPDPSVPIGETLAAMDEFVQAGKVRFIGCSKFDGALLDEAAAAAAANGLASFVSAQNEFSLLHQDGVVDDLLPACDRLGLALIPYFPLAGGLLTGKYRKGRGPASGTRLHRTAGTYFEGWLHGGNLDAVAVLEHWAADHGHTLLELAMSWLAAYPQVATIIAGATSPEQVEANVRALSWRLSPTERDEAAALVRDTPVSTATRPGG